jgi:AraC family transcriptional regulator
MNNGAVSSLIADDPSAGRNGSLHDRRAILGDNGCRRTLHQVSSLRIEDSVLPFARALGHSYSPETRFAFPYFGAFRWRVGLFERLIDSNAVLRVNVGEEFFESHPISGTGHASLILTPSQALLDELWATRKRGKSGDAPIVSPMSDQARIAVHALISDNASALKREELALDLMLKALHADDNGSRRTSRLVERAKEILHENLAEPVSLDWIARQLSVTPVYLTQTFKSQEGVPLYRYQTHLRLNRALSLLLGSSSITEVALALGYSSHAHFTATFSAAFGTTPTAYRQRRWRQR